jgi:hypothetical protein
MSVLEALSQKQLWVAWRAEERNGRFTKLPISPSGGPGRVDDESTWGTRAEAETMAKLTVNGHGGGIGIVLGDLGNGLALGGIDLDSCRSPDGSISPWADAVIKGFASYAEVSPSDTGIKIFFYYPVEALAELRSAMGTSHSRAWKQRGNQHPPAIELHLSNRYFTVTENKINTATSELAIVETAILLWLIREAGPNFAAQGEEARSTEPIEARDRSRSGKVGRMAFAMRSRGCSFSEYATAVRDDPETASWYTEKGIEYDERELRRAWERAPQADKSVEIICLADVEAEPVEWLWQPYIPRGKLTSVEGDPGVGKSWLTLAIAAAVSLGEKLPGMCEAPPPAKVLLIGVEDGPADTILPRFTALKGDPQQVLMLKEPPAFDEVGASQLRDAIVKNEIGLVVIDPIVAYMPGSTNINNAGSVRPVLARLAQIAHETKAAIVFVRHLTKGGRDKAIYRGLGSIDFTAACRSALMVGRDPANENKRILAHAKSNLAAPGKSLAYILLEGSFIWAGASALSAEDLAASPPDVTAQSALKEAVEFLEQILSNGPVPATTIKVDAEGTGLSWVTVRRAAKSMGIKPRKGGFKDGWVWELSSSPPFGHEDDFLASKVTKE